MTLLRTLVLLVGGLLAMLAVVILRAETTRLAYEVSQCEQRAEVCRQQLREAELELARLRNPMVIRDKAQRVVKDMLEAQEPPPPPKRGRPQ